jgi:hypothetical protein
MMMGPGDCFEQEGDDDPVDDNTPDTIKNLGQDLGLLHASHINVYADESGDTVPEKLANWSMRFRRPETDGIFRERSLSQFTHDMLYL